MSTEPQGSHGCWLIGGRDDLWSSEGYVDIEDLIQAALQVWPQDLILEFGGSPTQDMSPEEKDLLWNFCIQDNRHITLDLSSSADDSEAWIFSASSHFQIPLDAGGLQHLRTLFGQRCHVEITCHFHLRHQGKLLMTGYDYPSFLFFSPETPEAFISKLASLIKKPYLWQADSDLQDPLIEG